MIFTKIQVIKLMRDTIPGLGLKEAKTLVDAYELRAMEDRTVNALVQWSGSKTADEARSELQSWAYQFVANEKRREAITVDYLNWESRYKCACGNDIIPVGMSDICYECNSRLIEANAS